MKRWFFGYFPASARARFPRWGKYRGVWANVRYTTWYIGPFELWRYDVETR